MRKAEIRVKNTRAGWLIQNDPGYQFEYDARYLQFGHPEPVSLTLPLRSEPYTSNILFPFFDGLIPEGWLLDIAEKNWKLHERDRMGLLMACCEDCIGAVSVRAVNEEEAL